ncbi:MULTISPECIES: ABC transporter ATP-binding protein [unclassified Kribbella]|uniref:ABC transporter ATP-binding protein n=1 Tax=unclassified Kribbella TaxID=2644121 RepID=UPI0037A32A65|nr:ABC transporter ATP-binding protein [Kribbella sp. NBC_00889]
MPVAVEIDNLVVRYGEKAAVDGLSLTVTVGTVTSVLGPNGAGKTTTVESCEGFRRPESGRVRVLGLDPIADHDELMPRIGVMLQEGGAWSGVRAVEMLKYVATLHSHPLEIPALVERLDLGSCGRTPYRRLSGGQKQRLSFALAIVGRPEVAFLDEPTTGLDPHGRREIWQLIRDLRDDGVTVVLTTHGMDEAEQLSDQVHVVSAGKVIASGTPDALTEHGAKSLEDVYLALTAPPKREHS